MEREWTLKITGGGSKDLAKIEVHNPSALTLMSAICGIVELLKKQYDLDEKFVFELIEISYFKAKEQLMKN